MLIGCDLIKEVLFPDLLETDKNFIGGIVFGLSRGTENRTGTIFCIAEEQGSWVGGGQTVQPIGACRKSLARDGELVGYVDHDLVDCLALSSNTQTGDADQGK